MFIMIAILVFHISMLTFDFYLSTTHKLQVRVWESSCDKLSDKLKF